MERELPFQTFCSVPPDSPVDVLSRGVGGVRAGAAVVTNVHSVCEPVFVPDCKVCVTLVTQSPSIDRQLENPTIPSVVVAAPLLAVATAGTFPPWEIRQEDTLGGVERKRSRYQESNMCKQLREMGTGRRVAEYGFSLRVCEPF